MNIMERTKEILSTLVAFGAAGEGNRALIQYVEGLCRESDMEVIIDPSPDGKNANLIARLGPRVPGGIGFSAHTDVVPVGDVSAWHTDPWTLTEKDGVWFGRGALDNLGALAALLAELPMWAAAARDGKLQRPLYSLLTHSEEPDSSGLRSRGMPSAAPILFENMKAAPDLFIVGMPTEGEVVSGHPAQVVGCTITCTAKGGFAFDPRSENAFDVATLVNAQLIHQGEQLQAAQVHVATVTKVENVTRGPVFVPTESVLTLDVRTAPGISKEEVIKVLETYAHDAIKDIAKPEQITVSAVGINPGFLCNDEQALALALRLAGREHTVMSQYASEAPYLGTTAIVWGPGKIFGDSTKGIGGAHAPNEGIEVQSLSAFKERLGVVLEYCCN